MPPRREEERTTRDMIDLRVGKVTKCTVHPDADKLYVEEIDLTRTGRAEDDLLWISSVHERGGYFGEKCDCGGKLEGEENARGEIARDAVSGVERDTRPSGVVGSPG